MDDKRPQPPQPAPPRSAPAKLAARQQREAAALRANLRKRKDQARSREAPKQERTVSDPARGRMPPDAFIAWAMKHPEASHYELVAGEVGAIARECSVHALTKAR